MAGDKFVAKDEVAFRFAPTLGFVLYIIGWRLQSAERKSRTVSLDDGDAWTGAGGSTPEVAILPR